MVTQFSESVSEIIGFSKEEANRLQNRFIEPDHLMLGLIRFDAGRAIQILEKLHVDLYQLKQQLEDHLKQSSDPSLKADYEVQLSTAASRLLKVCIFEAAANHQRIADTEHILLAILKDNNETASILDGYGITYKKVLSLLPSNTNLDSATEIPADDEDDDDDEEEDPAYGEDSTFESYEGKPSRHKTVTSAPPVQKTPYLDKYGIDMTKKAEQGKFDPVIGREKEILRLEQILCRRKKNNPILIGEPGVGKSAIVEGLAQQIVQKKISHVLFNKRVIQLDMAGVVAGTKYRGQFEERMQGLLKELQHNDDVILFIDEIHTIIGAGSAPGTMDAANMLKPALARGDMQCIGATTIDEYRKNIEKDGALDRRFQKVLVSATTPEETLQILRNIKDRYEDHHNVTYTDEALDACVKLTGRYITDRNFPDKAIDALDEAGSRMHLTTVTIPKEITDQQALIVEMQEKKNNAVKSQNFELAASYRDKERQLDDQLSAMQKEWEQKLRDDRKTVTADDIADVVSVMSGIPVQRIAQSEGLRLTNLKSQLQSVIVAQDDTIDKTVKAIMRNRVGLKDPNKPIGTFMFLGPTGVGKTYLTKELAKFMFGSEDALIRIDMSEYMDKYTVSRLIGAPPGYVGYDEGGQLTEKVKRKPYSIVLFDEIEKAHPDVFNLLLQIMDEGRLTDSYGVTVDFKNTIIIMTSNVGTRQIREFGRGVGFSTSASMSDKDLSRNYVRKALNKTFAPEFINRIDEIITFDQLSKDAILRIVDIELGALNKRIETMNYHVTVDDDAKRFLADKGYDVQFGARPLKRVIQNYVEDCLSELIISGKATDGDSIVLSYHQGDEELTPSVVRPTPPLLPSPDNEEIVAKDDEKA
jgi:ATP-dependent Clp protease ATP-binding subunit ClpC